MLFYFIQFIKPKDFDIHIIRHEKITPDAGCCFYIVAYLDSFAVKTQTGTSDDPSYRE